MGLIRKAAEQGRQAVDAVRRRSGRRRHDLDVVIVGCRAGGARRPDWARWSTGCATG
jgi:hypothetical protein